MGTTLVNASFLHQMVANNNMPSTKFKKCVISELLDFPTNAVDTIAPANELPALYYFVEKQGAERGRCVPCYKWKTEEVGRKAAAHQNNFSCSHIMYSRYVYD